MTHTETATRFDAVTAGQEVYTLAKGWLVVKRVVGLLETEGRRATRLHLAGGFAVTDTDVSTIMTRTAQPFANIF